MNFLQIVNRVRQNCGVASADLTTVLSQSGENQRIINWVNESWLDIQAMRQDWLWMRKDFAFPTVAGQTAYTPIQIGLSDFGLWARDSFRNYANPISSISIATPCVISLQANRLISGDTVKFSTSSALPTGLTAGVTYFVVNPTTDTFQVALIAGGTAINTTGTQSGIHKISSNNTQSFVGLNSEIFMDYMDYDIWRDNYQYGALRAMATRPNTVTINPAKSLELGPIADIGYTVVGEYYATPTELALDVDIPALPIKFHLAIVYAAMIRYGMYEAASEVIQQGQTEYAKWKQRILADQLPEFQTGGALA
jgi:hypothetical protein